MQVPYRKPGKYTHQKTDPNITQEKHEKLKSELDKLTVFVRPRLADEVKRLALMGDFSENAAYQIAKGKLRGINQRILDIEDLLKRAEIIESPEDKSHIQLGHHVTVEVNGQERTYLILGSTETNPGSGIISHNSPIGSALMGKKIGDTVKIKIADREIEYKVINIA